MCFPWERRLFYWVGETGACIVVTEGKSGTAGLIKYAVKIYSSGKFINIARIEIKKLEKIKFLAE